ncbi:hypothetical protein Ahia01_000175800 [Argonauta hians]
MALNVTPIIFTLLLCLLFPKGNCQDDKNLPQTDNKLNENNVAEEKYIQKRSSGFINPEDLKSIDEAIYQQRNLGNMEDFPDDQYNGDALSQVAQLLRRSIPSGDGIDYKYHLKSIPRIGRLKKRSIPSIEEADNTRFARQVTLPRYGKDEGADDAAAEQYLASLISECEIFTKEGICLQYKVPNMNEKRQVNMLRLGRSMPIDEKRAVSMLRLGRSGFDSMKRAVSMLRLGRNSGFPSEKRAMSSLRLGRSQSDESKRAVSMLRLGRRAQDVDNDKRAVSMLRLGRSGADDSKRAVSMLRLGRSGKNNVEEKRSVPMLRLGRSDTN